MARIARKAKQEPSHSKTDLALFGGLLVLIFIGSGIALGASSYLAESDADSQAALSLLGNQGHLAAEGGGGGKAQGSTSAGGSTKSTGGGGGADSGAKSPSGDKGAGVSRSPGGGGGGSQPTGGNSQNMTRNPGGPPTQQTGGNSQNMTRSGNISTKASGYTDAGSRYEAVSAAIQKNVQSATNALNKVAQNYFGGINTNKVTAPTRTFGDVVGDISKPKTGTSYFGDLGAPSIPKPSSALERQLLNEKKQAGLTKSVTPKTEEQIRQTVKEATIEKAVQRALRDNPVYDEKTGCVANCAGNKVKDGVLPAGYVSNPEGEGVLDDVTGDTYTDQEILDAYKEQFGNVKTVVETGVDKFGNVTIGNVPAGTPNSFQTTPVGIEHKPDGTIGVIHEYSGPNVPASLKSSQRSATPVNTSPAQQSAQDPKSANAKSAAAKQSTQQPTQVTRSVPAVAQKGTVQETKPPQQKQGTGAGGTERAPQPQAKPAAAKTPAKSAGAEVSEPKTQTRSASGNDPEQREVRRSDEKNSPVEQRSMTEAKVNRIAKLQTDEGKILERIEAKIAELAEKATSENTTNNASGGFRISPANSDPNAPTDDSFLNPEPLAPLQFVKNFKEKIRNKPVSGDLLEDIRKTVGRVYGKNHTVVVVSGGQSPKGCTSCRRTGSVRHDIDPKTGKSIAVDINITGPNGESLTAEELAPFAQDWQANKLGSTGYYGNSMMHVDLKGGKKGRALQGVENFEWDWTEKKDKNGNYIDGTGNPVFRQAVLDGRKGIRPDYKGTDGDVAPLTEVKASIPKSLMRNPVKPAPGTRSVLGSLDGVLGKVEETKEKNPETGKQIAGTPAQSKAVEKTITETMPSDLKKSLDGFKGRIQNAKKLSVADASALMEDVYKAIVGQDAAGKVSLEQIDAKDAAKYDYAITIPAGAIDPKYVDAFTKDPVLREKIKSQLPGPKGWTAKVRVTIGMNVDDEALTTTVERKVTVPVEGETRVATNEKTPTVAPNPVPASMTPGLGLADLSGKKSDENTPERQTVNREGKGDKEVAAAAEETVEDDGIVKQAGKTTVNIGVDSYYTVKDVLQESIEKIKAWLSGGNNTENKDTHSYVGTTSQSQRTR